MWIPIQDPIRAVEYIEVHAEYCASAAASFVGLRLEVYGKEFRGRGSRCGVFSILSACKRVACDTPRMNAECLSHTRRLTSYEDCTLVG